MKKWIWVLIAGMLLGQACDSASTEKELQNNVQAEEDSIRKANLDREVQNVVERFGLMGMSLIVLDSGKKVYETYLGMADLGRNIETSEKTTYCIASISKTMTATAAIQLYEKGKLDIDADVEEYLGFPVRNPRFPDAITLRLLLSHKSSIRDGEGYGKFARDMISDSLNIKELFLKEGKYYTNDMFADHKPGEYFSYTNSTWGLIASIVEKISGERFDDYCTKNIFEPLDMDATFNIRKVADINNIAVLYRYRDGQWNPQAGNFQGTLPEPRASESYEPGHNGLIYGPQGGLKASIRDLEKYVRMMWNNGMSETGNQILSPESVKLMTDPHWVYSNNNGNTWDKFFMSYGFGIHRLTNQDSADIILPDREMYGHPGIAYGLVSDMYYDPITKSGVLFATNGSKLPYEHGDKTAFYGVEEALFEQVYKYLFLKETE